MTVGTMHLQYEGPNEGEFLLLVGEWDPPLPAQAMLFREAVEAAELSGLNVLVVTLYPSPSRYFLGATYHMPFHDVVARQFLQAKSGVQTRAVVSLSQFEAEKCGADFLISGLCRTFSIAQFAQGARQNLGIGGLGDSRAIADACDKHMIRLSRLSPASHRLPIADARGHLRNGMVRRSVDLFGFPLCWSRPHDGYVSVPWPAGHYTAYQLSEPFLPSTEFGAAISIDLKPFGELSRFWWPNKAVPWLGFIAGPGDAAADHNRLFQ